MYHYKTEVCVVKCGWLLQINSEVVSEVVVRRDALGRVRSYRCGHDPSASLRTGSVWPSITRTVPVAPYFSRILPMAVMVFQLRVVAGMPKCFSTTALG